MDLLLQHADGECVSEKFVSMAATMPYASRRTYNLRIISCYIDVPSIKKMIQNLKSKVKIKSVEIQFEYLEAFRQQRPDELQAKFRELEQWCKKSDLTLGWHPIRVGALMHAKAYALLNNGNESEGMVLLGSSNATARGLGTTSRPAERNVELVAYSKESDSVSSFSEVWNSLLKSKRSLNDAVKKEDEFALAFTLLSSGLFLHDWRESLSAKLGIVYNVTPRGKEQTALTLSAELRAFGYDLNQATFSRNPLQGIELPTTQSLPAKFTKKYTVDTFMGRWCPKDVWETVEKEIRGGEQFLAFRDALQTATNRAGLALAVEREAAGAKRLEQQGLIENDPLRIERWKEKVSKLRSDDRLLSRIFIKHESFELPYDLHSRSEVLELFDNLNQTVALKRRKSFVAGKWIAARDSRNPAQLALTTNEKAELRTFLVTGD